MSPSALSFGRVSAYRRMGRSGTRRLTPGGTQVKEGSLREQARRQALMLIALVVVPVLR